MAEFAANGNLFVEYERNDARSYIITNIRATDAIMVVVTPTRADNTYSLTEAVLVGESVSLELPMDDIYNVVISSYAPDGQTLVEISHQWIIEIGDLMTCYTQFLEGLYCVEQDEEQVEDEETYCSNRNLIGGVKVFEGDLSEKRRIMCQVNAMLFIFYIHTFNLNRSNQEYEAPLAERQALADTVKVLWTNLLSYFESKKIANDLNC